MGKASVSSIARKLKRNRGARLIESIEPRAYFNGVVFGPAQNLNATAAGIAPVFVNLDFISSATNADLITANATGSTGSVSILPGNGNGTFGTARTVPLTFSPLTIQDGLLGTNGKIDLVVGSTNSNKVAVILQANDGTLSKTEYTATGLSDTQSVAIGDFNNDGHLDFAVASFDTGQSNNVAVFFNDGTGGFTLHQVLSVPHTHLASLAAFSAGGRTHLAIADADNAKVTVVLNDGAGTFASGLDYGVGSAPVTIKAGKFNLSNNQNDDLVTANSTGGSVSVLLGNGDGSFQSTAVTTLVSGVPAGGGPLKVRVANLNSDGLPDLISLLPAASTGDAEVLLGNGDGTFHVGNIITAGGGARTTIAAGDLNGDQLTDMVLADTGQVTALINITNQDTTPPVATVDVTQPAPVPGASTIQFTVTYSDAQQVDAQTINSANITVVDPNNQSQPVTLVSTNLANGPSITATYSIPAPSGALSVADNGLYTVTATGTPSQAVTNANGLPVAGGQIGQFNLQVPLPSNGPNLVAGAVKAILRSSVVAGTHSIGGATVTLVNAGNQAAKGTIVINLYASPDQMIRGDAPLLSTVTRKINLRQGGRAVFALPGFVWPANLSGALFLVANVNATRAVGETNFGDNVAISSVSTTVNPPFVDIQNLWGMRLPAVFKVGKRIVIPVLLKNAGNVRAVGTATVTVLASPTGSASDAIPVGTPPVRVAIPAGLRQVVNVPFTVPALAPGQYHLLITVSLPGDTNAGNDTVISTGTFTV